MSEPKNELRQGEVWLGNRPTEDGIRDDEKHLKTIRLGLQAYDIHDKPIDPAYMLPLIIHKSEEQEYDRIYQNRMKNG